LENDILPVGENKRGSRFRGFPTEPVGKEVDMARFSANLGFLWPDLPLLDRVDAAGRAGFKAIEMHWPYDLSPQSVRDLCRKYGMELLGINTVPGNFAAGENGLGALPGREREFQAAVDQSINFCAEAGGKAVHCMAGRVEANDRSQALKVFVANLRTAAAKAGDAGLTVLLEPLNIKDAPGYFYSRASEGVSVLEEVDRPNVKLMFDGYHVGMMGDDVVETLDRYYPVVGHVQIAAVPSRAEPDEGTVDFRKLLKALDERGYAGWVGAEYKPRGQTDAGLSWMQSLNV
jgi:2-dehydrotetronate isomerase